MSDSFAFVLGITTVIGVAIPATISALAARDAAKAAREASARSLVNTAKIEEVHHALNSALDKRVDSAKAEGNLAGRLEQTQERKDAKGDPL